MRHTLTMFVGALVLAVACHAQTMVMLDVQSDTLDRPARVEAAAPVADPATQDELLTRLGEDPAAFGKRVAVHDSGFDPHVDSPAFRNFTSFLLGKKGDCVGISYFCQQIYLRISFTGGEAKDVNPVQVFREALAEILKDPLSPDKVPVAGYSNLMEATKNQKIADGLRQLITVAQQVRNIHPEALHCFTPQIGSWDSELGKLNSFLDRGRPVLMAMTEPLQFGGGHVVLAYKVVEYEKKSLVLLYDSNAGPDKPDQKKGYVAGDEDATYRTLLEYDKASGKVDFHKAYKALKGYKYKRFVVFEGPNWKNLPGEVVRFFTKTLPSKIKAIFPVSALERGKQIFVAAHNWIRSHLGLPF